MTLRRAGRIAGRVAVALVSAAVLGGTGVAWAVGQQVGSGLVTSRAVAAPPVAPDRPFTALLVGLDARTDAHGNPLPQSLLDAMHAGPDEGQLHTDTMILLHVPAPGDGPVVAISVPRDSYVALADGSGQHKINSAYDAALKAAEAPLSARGVTGPALDQQGREAGRAALIATMQAFTGTRIDHYAEINMAGFVELTDTLGGVPVCLNAPAHDDYTGIDMPAGQQTVRGGTALAFVRQRHGLVGGDFDRVRRQQAFIAGLTQRLRTTGTLTDPAALSNLIAVADKYVVIDAGWDVTQAMTQVGRFAGHDLVFRTIPTGRPDLWTPEDGEAVQVDPATVQAFVAEQFAPRPASAAISAPVPTPGATPAAAATPTPSPATTSAAAGTAGAITAAGVPCVD